MNFENIMKCLFDPLNWYSTELYKMNVFIININVLINKLIDK